MKRIITLFIIALFCFSLTSCATENKVTAEPFESMEISFTKMGMLATYDNLDELIEASSLIVIASPVNTFTDEAPTFLDINGNPVDSYEQASRSNCYTLRDFKINKVLKGDKSLKEVTVAERFVEINSDSTNKIIGLKGEYIAKKNAKYMLFLMPSNYKNDHYFTCYNVGKINIDGKDPNCEQIVDQKVLSEVKNAYKDEFIEENQ